MMCITTLRCTYVDAARSPGLLVFSILMEGGDVVMTDEREQREPLTFGREYEVTIRAAWDESRIIDAELLDAEAVSDGDPIQAWREWFKSVGGEYWETVDDIDRELREEDDDA